MQRGPFDLSSKSEILTFVICVALSLTLLVLPTNHRIRVADRLSLVLTSPYWKVRNFGEDVLRTRDENAWLRRRLTERELMRQTGERIVRDAGRMAGPALDPGFEGELVPCRVVMRQRSRFATMIKIHSLEPVSWDEWQPVISSHGYLGRIRTVINSREAWVELLSAQDFALGVEVDRTGLLGVMRPRANRYVVEMIGRDEDVRVGDLVVTSGIAEVREGIDDVAQSGLNPRGFPVGRVSHVASPSEMIFKEIEITPLAQLNHNETVFLVLPYDSGPALEVRP